MFRMVECVKSELKSMKHGLYNVIPVELLSGITAEVSVPHDHLLCSRHWFTSLHARFLIETHNYFSVLFKHAGKL